MSARGVDFLRKWLSSNLSGMASADIITVAHAIERLLAEAKASGIDSVEIEEEVGSIYKAVLDAIMYHVLPEGG